MMPIDEHVDPCSRYLDSQFTMREMRSNYSNNDELGDGFKYFLKFLMFTPTWGSFPFWRAGGLVQPPSIDDECITKNPQCVYLDTGRSGRPPAAKKIRSRVATVKSTNLYELCLGCLSPNLRFLWDEKPRVVNPQHLRQPICFFCEKLYHLTSEFQDGYVSKLLGSFQIIHKHGCFCCRWFAPQTQQVNSSRGISTPLFMWKMGKQKSTDPDYTPKSENIFTGCGDHIPIQLVVWVFLPPKKIPAKGTLHVCNRSRIINRSHTLDIQSHLMRFGSWTFQNIPIKHRSPQELYIWMILDVSGQAIFLIFWGSPWMQFHKPWWIPMGQLYIYQAMDASVFLVGSIITPNLFRGEITPGKPIYFRPFIYRCYILLHLYITGMSCRYWM